MDNSEIVANSKNDEKSIVTEKSLNSISLKSSKYPESPGLCIIFSLISRLSNQFRLYNIPLQFIGFD